MTRKLPYQMLLVVLLCIFSPTANGFSAVAPPAVAHPLLSLAQKQQALPKKNHQPSEQENSYLYETYSSQIDFPTRQVAASSSAAVTVQPSGINPFQKISSNICNMLGIDKSKIGNLGVSFALAYSLISNLNGAVSLSTAWYMTSVRTGLSPLVAGQWPELLKSYGMLFAILQCLKPFRMAAAVALSPYAQLALQRLQHSLQCSKGMAAAMHYVAGWIVTTPVAVGGVLCASGLSGVPLVGA